MPWTTFFCDRLASSSSLSARALRASARDRLLGLGYGIEWHEYPMMHQVCLEEIQALGTWLRARLCA